MPMARIKTCPWKNSEMEEAKEAFAGALRARTRRDHSESELTRKLCDKGFKADVIAKVITRLKDLNYLDDRRLAVRWAESAIKNFKGYGLKLRLELSRRGIPEVITAEVVADLAAEHDETEVLAALLARKFPGFDAGVA